MHKSIMFTFGLLMSSLVMLSAIPMLNNNNSFTKLAMAQGYDNNYGYSSYSQYPTDDKKYECRTGPFEGFFVSSVEFCKHVKFDDKKDRDDKVGPQGPPGQQGPQGETGPAGQNATEVIVNNIRDPVTNQTLQCVLNTDVNPASIDCIVFPPLSQTLTVSKEMFICSDPDIIPSGEVDGFQRFQIDCREDSDLIPDPDSPVWVPWENCNVNEEFCSSLSEEDFTMQIEQNPGPNFIIFEFPVNSDGRSVIVESGTYQITEEVTIPNACPSTTSYGDGLVQIVESTVPFITDASFCFTLEGDCSGTIQAGEEKACTVKNYLVNGLFQVPIGGLTASDTNTDTSSFDINNEGTEDSPVISQGIKDSPKLTGLEKQPEGSPELTATEKITKLKTQWLDLLS